MNSFQRRNFLRACASLGLLGLAPRAALAQGSRPLRLIVPLSVGSTGDVIGRRLAAALEKPLGQSVYVDNIPGAGGMLGTGTLVQAPKDGNTLAIVSTGHVINPYIYRKMPFDSMKDITPIALIGNSPQILVVNPSVPAKNVKELVAYAKSKPGVLNFGSSGNGTSLHLLGAKFVKDTGIEVTHVPYKGNNLMFNDLLAGQVQFAFQATTGVATYVKAGRLRAIGVTTKVRSKLMPDVPTLAEQGLTDFDVGTWMVAFGPSGLPPTMVEKLNKAFNDAIGEPKMKAWLTGEDWTLTKLSAAQTRSFLEAEMVKYRKLVTDAGAKIDQ
jgi:tripartite-type tricarboxylate transporter receptor subunit TctC